MDAKAQQQWKKQIEQLVRKFDLDCFNGRVLQDPDVPLVWSGNLTTYDISIVIIITIKHYNLINYSKYFYCIACMYFMFNCITGEQPNLL